MGQFGSKNDGATLTLSVMALLVAIVLSINTFTGQAKESAFGSSDDPFDQAQAAAQAGLEIAKWQMEFNGRTARGSLPTRYWLNGAKYSVEWDDVDLNDSTVNVRSCGEAGSNDNLVYRSIKRAKIKLEFLPAEKNAVLSNYYSQPRPPVDNYPIH